MYINRFKCGQIQITEVTQTRDEEADKKSAEKVGPQGYL